MHTMLHAMERLVDSHMDAEDYKAPHVDYAARARSARESMTAQGFAGSIRFSGSAAWQTTAAVELLAYTNRTSQKTLPFRIWFEPRTFHEYRSDQNTYNVPVWLEITGGPAVRRYIPDHTNADSYMYLGWHSRTTDLQSAMQNATISGVTPNGIALTFPCPTLPQYDVTISFEHQP